MDREEWPGCQEKGAWVFQLGAVKGLSIIINVWQHDLTLKAILGGHVVRTKDVCVTTGQYVHCHQGILPEVDGTKSVHNATRTASPSFLSLRRRASRIPC